MDDADRKTTRQDKCSGHKHGGSDRHTMQNREKTLKFIPVSGALARKVIWIGLIFTENDL
jgi:hypothetical protein